MMNSYFQQSVKRKATRQYNVVNVRAEARIRSCGEN